MFRIFKSMKSKLKPFSSRGITVSSSTNQYKKPLLFTGAALTMGVGASILFKKMNITNPLKMKEKKPELAIDQVKLDSLYQSINEYLKEILKKYGLDAQQQKGFLLLCLTEYNIDLSKIKFSDLQSANEWLIAFASAKEAHAVNWSFDCNFFKHFFTGDERQVLIEKSGELLGMIKVVKPDHSDQDPFDAIFFNYDLSLTQEMTKSMRLGRTPDKLFYVIPETRNLNYEDRLLSFAIQLENEKKADKINPHTKFEKIVYKEDSKEDMSLTMIKAEAIANHPSLSKKKVVIYMCSSDASWQFPIIRDVLMKANPAIKVCLCTQVDKSSFNSYSFSLSDMIAEKYPEIRDKLHKESLVMKNEKLKL